MSRSLKAILMLAMLLAVILAGILFSDLLRDRQALHDLEAQLADSRASWESIAEKKEALQDELKVAEEALKERVDPEYILNEIKELTQLFD